MRYYVFDLQAEETVSKDFDTVEQANEILCVLAGIKPSEITDYLSSNGCRYEIRAYGG